MIARDAAGDPADLFREGFNVRFGVHRDEGRQLQKSGIDECAPCRRLSERDSAGAGTGPFVADSAVTESGFI